MLRCLSLLIPLLFLFLSTPHSYIHPLPLHYSHLSFRIKFIIHLFILLAVIIPPPQFPFQTWFIQSLAAPTPVSAIMH
ncbi:proton-conducting transporter transmembrane domain-containing protein, partial [Staphylococcus warneri]|uniref:proton-conducting transporter transmembrane domain-containing protein n=1 Tax=Staphylococcus warneri TaxID=1292 RepID=UPI0034D982AB